MLHLENPDKRDQERSFGWMDKFRWDLLNVNLPNHHFHNLESSVKLNHDRSIRKKHHTENQIATIEFLSSRQNSF